jgi:hypothetical protein
VWNSTWWFFSSRYPLLDAPRGQKKSVRKNDATASFLGFLNPAGPRNLGMCWLLLTEFFSFYGRTRIVLVKKNLARKYFTPAEKTGVKVSCFYCTFLGVGLLKKIESCWTDTPSSITIYGQKIGQYN